MYKTSVAPFMVYDMPEVPVETQLQWVGETSADGVEIAVFHDTDLHSVECAASTHDVTVASVTGFGAEPLADPAMTDPKAHDAAVRELKRTIDAADRLGAPSVLAPVGPVQEGLSQETQLTAVVDALIAVDDYAQGRNVQILLEPLNTVQDHEGYFLESIQTALDVLDRVGDIPVNLLFDVYHRQIMNGDIIRALRTHIDRIGHVHIADAPGRHEPGTGELNYENILKSLVELEYDGFVGCEYFPSGPPRDCLESTLELIQSVGN